MCFFFKPLTGRYAIAILVFLFSTYAYSKPSSIPDKDIHQKFLVSKWQDDAPVLIVFKDPFCPYCVKAFKSLDELKKYNVFIFWSPILGDRSVARVERFFECQNPVGNVVIDAVIGRVQPACDGEMNLSLRKKNYDMVGHYEPKIVPSYYLGGKRVGLSQLKRTHKKTENKLATVVLNWDRYKRLKLQQRQSNAGQLMIVFPNTYSSLEKLLDGVDGSFDEFQKYIVVGSQYENVCPFLEFSCSNEEESSYLSLSEEVKLLYGLEDIKEPRFILNGKLLSRSEQAALKIKL